MEIEFYPQSPSSLRNDYRPPPNQPQNHKFTSSCLSPSPFAAPWSQEVARVTAPFSITPLITTLNPELGSLGIRSRQGSWQFVAVPVSLTSSPSPTNLSCSLPRRLPTFNIRR